MKDQPCIIVIGGTGMLRPAVWELIERGSTVVAAARRPERGNPTGTAEGEYIPVEGEWSRPEELGDAIHAVLDERGAPRATAQGAIVWVHSPHRQAVLDQLERVLGPDATVLQLWGSAAQDPRDVMAQEDRPGRPWRTRHLFLGYRPGPGGSRWLSDDEISQAAVLAWDGEDGQVVAGQIDPWEHRP